MRRRRHLWVARCFACSRISAPNAKVGCDAPHCSWVPRWAAARPSSSCSRASRWVRGARVAVWASRAPGRRGSCWERRSGSPFPSATAVYSCSGAAERTPYWVGVPEEARANAAFSADLRRLGHYWTGSNYPLRWSDSWQSTLGRTRALAEQALAGRWKWLAGAALPLWVIGFLRLARRAPPVAWSVGGLCLGAALLLILVHTEGTAADFLPLVLMAAVCAGVGVSAVEPRALRGRLLATRYVIFLAAGLCVGQTYWHEPPIYDQVDARGFLAELDLALLPPGALVLTSYPVSPPIRYARHVARRPDLEIICMESDDAQELLGARLDDARQRERVVLLAGFVAAPDGWRDRPYRNIQRLSFQPEPRDS